MIKNKIRKIFVFFLFLLTPLFKVFAQFNVPTKYGPPSLPKYGSPDYIAYSPSTNLFSIITDSAGLVVEFLFIPAVLIIGGVIFLTKRKIKETEKKAIGQGEEEKISKLKKRVKRLLIWLIGLIIFIVGYILFKAMIGSMMTKYGPPF